ncbi:MAG TPA: ScyD/ScyE family protein [Chitinophagaceae bacterium]|nr:ScyD/ScyE family protein [Chitinophagaceae bacterium]
MQTTFKISSAGLFQTKHLLRLLFFILLITSCKKEINQSVTNQEAADKNSVLKSISSPATVTLFSTGFNNPRGLKFGPDGYLYVAEAGTGEGTTHSCPALFPDFYIGSPTGGRISKVTSAGVRTTVTANLPTSSSIWGDVIGVADVAFIDNTLYALLNGAGCSHGVPTVPNGIVRINSNGTFTVVADLGGWQQLHPVANPPGDFEPEGTWYSMISVGNALYPMDSNHGELVKVTPDGSVTRIVDFTVGYGHTIPTAIAYHGNFYVGNLGTFPIVDGSSNIYKVTPSGQTKISETGFSTILGLVIDKNARMYVLENTTGNAWPTPFTGRIVRVNANGSKEVIATGLSFPTGMTMGPDGNLYVSNWGFGAALGDGQVLKVTLN